MKEKNDDYKVLREKISYYLKEKTYLFIQTKDSFTYNGTVFKIGESFIIFTDRFSGKIFISFSEIERAEPNNHEKKGKGK